MRYALQWVCDSPSPYNAFLFRSLASDPNIDLTVHFIRPIVATHPWQTHIVEGFHSRPYQRAMGMDWHLIRLAVTAKRSLLVTGSWYEPTIQLALTLRQGPFVIWTDTPNLQGKRSPLKALLRPTWLRWVFARASAVMGTGWPALEALRQMHCPEHKLVNFPYFIDLKTYSPRQNERGKQPFVFASSGQLHRRKGYDIALSALAQVYRGRSQCFKYRIAGTGSEARNLAQQAKELGIGESVEFLGWLEPDELPGLYASADVFLHPARVEPYGVAVLEAMASGLIVIGSDATAAVLDRIHSGLNGFVHRSNDPDDLAKQICAVVDNIERRDQIKIAARRTAEEWPVTRGVEIVKQLLQGCLK